MPYKVSVTREIPDPGIPIVREIAPDARINPDDRVLTRGELLDYVRGCDGVLCLLTDPIDAEVLDAAGPQCRIFANYAVGYNNIDVAAATARGIMVTNTPGVLTDATADHAWALLFSVARRIVEGDAFMRAGKFEGWGPMMFLGGDITGKTLGIVGAGRIGAAMALKSRGFGMRVLYADVARNEELESDLGAQWVDLDTLLAESDFVSLHVALTPETVHLINAERLGKMKPTAYLINTSRGPVVDEIALVDALTSRRIAGAGLDVYEDEPAMKPGLADCPNAVIVPHIASATNWTRSKMAEMAATNLVAGLKGETPPNLVNPEVLDQ
ncbi:MAG: D-glycerate dehydrogenase [candidate division WS1 bacterium]|jgi:glyoxylate reductase|nr:D-glycerate dehydrogenase [candidate division WS1 bacterium]